MKYITVSFKTIKSKPVVKSDLKSGTSDLNKQLGKNKFTNEKKFYNQNNNDSVLINNTTLLYFENNNPYPTRETNLVYKVIDDTGHVDLPKKGLIYEFKKDIYNHLYSQSTLKLYLYTIILNVIFFTITTSSLKLLFYDFGNPNFYRNSIYIDQINQPNLYMGTFINILLAKKIYVFYILIFIFISLALYNIINYIRRKKIRKHS